MKKTINVLVIEDNEYYNRLIYNELQQSPYFIRNNENYKLVLHSIIDSYDCLEKIASEEFIDNEVIAFVDYYVGSGITGKQIIRQLKNDNRNTLAILLSKSNSLKNKYSCSGHDFFVLKDTSAPALCRHYLDKYIESKFL